MKEIDAHFDTYEHLDQLPDQKTALTLLRKAASLVKPIMRKRGWKVDTLGEMLPPDARLLGLNYGKTERILVRLRYTESPAHFIPFKEIIDTLLHELAHIVHGRHHAAFHALWDELRYEHSTLVARGYTGEGFLSDGRRVGGRRVPVEELRRKARLAAMERHQREYDGDRLGGRRASRREDMRQVIADAAAKRTARSKEDWPVNDATSSTSGCAAGTDEGAKAAEEAKNNSVRTTAERTDADDLAIANALIELMEAEEMEKLCNSSPHIDPVGRPAWTDVPPISRDATSTSSAKMQRNGIPDRFPRRKPRDGSGKSSAGDLRREDWKADIRAAVPDEPLTWPCHVCTLQNTIQFLCCDACGTERKQERQKSHSVSSTLRSSSSAAAAQPASIGWKCSRCRSFMEHHWWTCSACGSMKASS